MLLDYDLYNSDNYLVVDLEVAHNSEDVEGDIDITATNPRTQVILACWWYKGKYYYKWGTELELQLLYRHMREADYIVAHNAGYELGFFLRARAVDPVKIRVADTMLAEHVILGNRRLPKDLDSCSKRRKIGILKHAYIKNMLHAGVNASKLPRDLLLNYCLDDVRITEHLWRVHRTMMNERDLLRVFHTRCMVTPILTEIESRGLMLDKRRVIEEYRGIPNNPEKPGVQYQYDRLLDELKEITGGININSPKQLSEYLYDTLGFKVPLTESGRVPKKRSTNQDTLAKLVPKNKAQTQFIEKLIEARKFYAAITKSLKPLFRCVTETDHHMIYAKFNQAVAQTHRLSSSGKPPYKVQFQNIANAYRTLFIPRHKGWKIVAADYGKLEFNVAAFLTQDPQAIRDIESGADIHRYTASVLYNKPESEITSEERRKSKPNTFGPLYGKVTGSPAQTAYFDAFRAKYSVIEKTFQDWITNVLKTKKLRTATGLIFYWPGAELKPSGYVVGGNQVRDYPIQNLASAEICMAGLRNLRERIAELNLKSFVNNTVHDSIVLECPEDEVETVENILQECLIDEVVEYLDKMYGIKYNIPLEIDIKIGDTWA